MEKFSITGADLREFYAADTELEQVFSDVEKDLYELKHVVCQYIVNGLRLSDKDEAKFAKVPLAEVESLEYIAAPADSMVWDVTKGWLEALPELMEAAEKISNHLRGGKKAGQLREIHQLLENVEYLMSSLIDIKGLLAEDVRRVQEAWDPAEQQSHLTVRQCLEAVDKKDFVILADVLEYDLSIVYVAGSNV